MSDLAAVLNDYQLMDAMKPEEVDGGLALSYEEIGEAGVRQVSIDTPLPVIGPVLRALALLIGCGKHEALLLNQVDRVAMIASILNCFLPGRLKRKLVLYDVFIDTPSPVKQRFVRWMVRGATVNVLFSRAQVTGYAEKFDLPESRFIYIPYQSSHSKRPPREEPYGDYVFAGGNSARDYRTLCDAVRGTGVRVRVTTTKPELFDDVDVPEEIERVRVVEPEFTKLMAESRFAVMCLTPGRVRGYGEQTILNSWWHGRAMVVADDVSAPDYVVNGHNGYCVNPGDVDALRERLVELWGDRELSEQMGRAGRETVAEAYTHDHFVHRLQMLTLLVAAS